MLVMYTRLINIPLQSTQSFFLFGPRGTGKTTWLKQAFPKAITLDLLYTETYKRLLANPSRLIEYIPKAYDGWIILDEVQRIPELLNEVHRLIESDSHRFILTGSSARKLRRKGVNLLAGRALTYHMYPLTSTELDADFSLANSISLGHLPSVYQVSDPQAYLQSYIDTYLREEVLQEGLTRNLSAFAQFLEIASFSQGNLINMTNIAREVGVDRKVIENYFTILEDLLIAQRLPVFTKRAQRRLVDHPKFYYFDVGVYRALRPRGPLDKPEEIDGAALESLVYQEIRAVNEYFNLQYDLFFWRTSYHTEVDFVLYGAKGFLAIEVKRSRTIQKKDLSGLKAFLSDYPQAKGFVFYGGKEHLYFDNIQAIPFDEALKTLPVILGQ